MHEAGTANDAPLELYHEVTDVHAPGRTLTLMVCGRGKHGRWGYVDPGTGEHLTARPDPGFMARFHALNPHRC